jgi:hypothetical protein
MNIPPTIGQTQKHSALRLQRFTGFFMYACPAGVRLLSQTINNHFERYHLVFF